MLSRRCGVDGSADGVDAVEGSGEDEIVVAVELLQAGCERSVVDEAAGFVDDEEGEDDPGEGLVDVQGPFRGTRLHYKASVVKSRLVVSLNCYAFTIIV